MSKLIVTIDGASGTGKEKIAKYIAKKYNLFHLDSGILYRRLASIILKKNINFNKEKDIKKILNSIIELSTLKNKVLRSEKI